MIEVTLHIRPSLLDLPDNALRQIIGATAVDAIKACAESEAIGVAPIRASVEYK